MTTTTLDAIQTRLLAGDRLQDIASDLLLDVIDNEHGIPMIALDGWRADDGTAEVEYEWADSGEEAAREYVDDGDWGDDSEQTRWITIYTWRVGLRLAPAECARCCEAATAHDEDGDLACARHAATPADGVTLAPMAPRVIESQTARESHDVAIEPAAPDCAEGAHDWQSPYAVLGGLRENPGVWGHGGGVIVREVCAHCGTYRVSDTWAQRRDTGRQGLRSLTYEEADETSLAWAGRSETLE